MTQTIRVSVVVSNMNGIRFLPRLYESLRAQREVQTEIIVVDRESKDGSREYLAGIPEIRVLTEPAASGLVAGYHAGALVASHELLFFCNEDLWLDPDCLSRLARHISMEDKIGAADPWQWSYDGSRHIHGGTRFLRTFFDPISCYPPRAFRFVVSLAGGERVPFCCPGALLIHRRMYFETGGWDTSFFMEFEDVDFFLRAWQRGWNCVAEPAAKVYHAVGMSTHQAAIPPQKLLGRRRISGESNRAVVCLKHFSGPSLFWAAVMLCRPLVAHSLHLRWQDARVYIEALRITWKRIPDVMNFRKANSDLRCNRPGQRFFTCELFQQ